MLFANTVDIKTYCFFLYFYIKLPLVVYNYILVVFNDEVGITVYELNPYEGVTRPSKVENYEKGIYLLLLKCKYTYSINIS
ncbi:hypothetical protein PFUGPA_02658 [Plasmodium falciparum Palo Alto/Uganda]|uniref:Uncharacterized protein n=3 Tax=Plasmodium falciparum TaxID=5833 RepID=W4J0D3_PLAFP|nr:hypothetical protein PFUGPA_02658 [Plasmodium falciparum Palo Alto/Uganda]ETW59173.1 hypothetical protein PFMC_04947 [Plasmodium falciparum CAMP/Malaysia]KNC37391.1 hypothetical protein PFLG_02503 [Plasmodium falciparum RAJ116]